MNTSKVRLTQEEITGIKSSVWKFDPNALIYLFGSRTDLTKRGGDIDLMIVSSTLSEVDKIKIEMSLFQKIEEQKIDLILTKDMSEPFVKVILTSGVLL